MPYPAAKDYGSREGWPTLAVVWHIAEGRNVAQYLSRDPLRGVSVHYTVEQETDRWQDGQVVRCLPEDRISGSINPRTIRRGDDPDGYYGASHASRQFRGPTSRRRCPSSSSRAASRRPSAA
jgi:hypothetical protein